MNKAIFAGTLFRDVTIAVTGNGKKVSRNVISVHQGKVNGKNIYEYVPVTAYEANADFLNTYFKKGKAIIAEAHYHGYKGSDEQYRYEFIVDKLNFAPSDYEQEQSVQQPQYQQPTYQQPQVQQPTYQPQMNPMGILDINSDDLPF